MRRILTRKTLTYLEATLKDKFGEQNTTITDYNTGHTLMRENTKLITTVYSVIFQHYVYGYRWISA